MNTDLTFLRQAITVAQQSAERGFDAFGAILVKDGRVVAKSIDLCIQDSDPTAHAEISVIRQYCSDKLLISLEGYTLYSSTEPCLMCSGAIHWSKLDRVVFCVSQAMLKTKSGGQLKPGCADYLSAIVSRTEVTGPLIAEEGMKVLEAFPFLSKKDRHRKFWK